MATNSVAEKQNQDYPIGYIPAIDGVRGVMPLGVLAAHVEYLWFPGAIVFMDVFFILSGYLITSILLKDLKLEGRINFRKFYIRRFLRLFPAYYFMLLVYCLATYVLIPEPRMNLFDALYAGTYISNWVRAFEVPTPDWLGHTWSLSIEEQFYLIWPVVLLFFIRKFPDKSRLLLALLVFSLCFTWWRFYLASNGASIVRLYNGTDVRADTLLVGCIIAIMMTYHLPPIKKVSKIARALILPVTIIVFVVLGFTLHWKNVSLYTWGTILIDGLVGLFLVGLLTSKGTIVHKIFENQVLIYLGKISYGTYLWHFPIFEIMRKVFGFKELEVATYGFLATYLMAVISYEFIEKRFIRAKRNFAYAPKAQ